MTAVLLAPHGDDETLFAAYTCMREKLHVIVCSQDAEPGVRAERSLETARAIGVLGCSHHEWPIPANARPDLRAMKSWLSGWATVDRVYAPAVDPAGQPDHNLIGELARQVFGDRVVAYTTYAPRGQRQHGSLEVVPTAAEIQRKLLALSCYSTQIENRLTRPWFYNLLDMREWHE